LILKASALNVGRVYAPDEKGGLKTASVKCQSGLEIRNRLLPQDSLM
jgi:hypothetical protein